MEEAIFFSARHGHNREVVQQGMTRLAAVFEHYIRQYPDQWYNFFRFWTTHAKE